MAKTHCLLSYDICSAKVRRKVVKELEGVARRVQYSVFETFLNEGELRDVVQRTGALLRKEDGDSLLVYRLCARCAEHREKIGGDIINWKESLILE